MDGAIVFRPLTRPGLRAIAGKLVAAVSERLLASQRVKLHVAPCLLDHVSAAEVDEVNPPRLLSTACPVCWVT